MGLFEGDDPKEAGFVFFGEDDQGGEFLAGGSYSGLSFVTG